MHLSRRVSSVPQCVWGQQTAVVSINHAHELSLPMCAIDLAGAACCGFYWSINFWLWWRLILLTVFQAFHKSVLLLFSSILSASYLGRGFLSRAGNIFLPLLMLSLLASPFLLPPTKSMEITTFITFILNMGGGGWVLIRCKVFYEQLEWVLIQGWLCYNHLWIKGVALR